VIPAAIEKRLAGSPLEDNPLAEIGAKSVQDEPFFAGVVENEELVLATARGDPNDNVPVLA
jgi:hypothetical protein